MQGAALLATVLAVKVGEGRCQESLAAVTEDTRRAISKRKVFKSQRVDSQSGVNNRTLVVRTRKPKCWGGSLHSKQPGLRYFSSQSPDQIP